MDERLEKLAKATAEQARGHCEGSSEYQDHLVAVDIVGDAFREVVKICALEVGRHYCSLDPDTSTCYDCGKHLDDPIHLGRTKHEPEDIAERIRALFSEDK